MGFNEFTAQEFQDGRKPSYQVIARVEPVAQDGSYHLLLDRALIETGAIGKVRGIEFQIVDDQPCAVFAVNSPVVYKVYPKIQEAQGLLTAGITHALTLQRFVRALNLLSKMEKHGA